VDVHDCYLNPSVTESSCVCCIHHHQCFPFGRRDRDNRTMASQPNSPRPGHDHTPAHPSGLRQIYTASSTSSVDEVPAPASPESNTRSAHNVAGPSRQRPTEATSLLGAALDFREQAHEGPCNHGTFSPRPTSPTNSIQAGSISPSESEAEASLPGIDGVLSEETRRRRNWKKRWASKMRSKSMSTSSALAEQHGVRDSALMYVVYSILGLSVGSLVLTRRRGLGTFHTTYLSWFGPASTTGPISRATSSAP
jgi:hypothetical protein